MSQSFPDVGPLPEIDTTAMIEVDRLMMEVYRINLFQMMENAGRCLAILAREIALDGTPEDKRVVVLAGRGGNGGGALTAARRLATWGANICVVTAQDRDQMAHVPKAQLDIQRCCRDPGSVDTGSSLFSSGCCKCRTNSTLIVVTRFQSRSTA